jgi:hypothetical protein
VKKTDPFWLCGVVFHCQSLGGSEGHYYSTIPWSKWYAFHKHKAGAILSFMMFEEEEEWDRQQLVDLSWNSRRHAQEFGTRIKIEVVVVVDLIAKKIVVDILETESKIFVYDVLEVYDTRHYD